MKSIITASLLGVAAAGFAQSQSEWTLSGYLDGYFQYNFGRPASGETMNGRGFDIAHNRLKLAVGEVDALLAPTEKRNWGVNIQLYAGKNADIIHLAEPGGKNKYKFIRQAYVTFVEPKSGWTFDFGKFDTWIGYEGVDNRTSDTYGRSFNWTYSEPTYETGLRATGKLSDKATLGLFIVRGWNEVEDGNDNPSFGAQLTYTVNPKTSIVVQNHSGDEGSDTANDVGSYGGIGLPNPGVAEVHLFDVILNHQLTDKTKLALNADFGSASGSSNSGKWNGVVLYLRHQVNDKQACSLRLERFEDLDGLRVGLPIRLHSITLGHDLTLIKNGTLRFELRHDLADQPFFVDKDGLAKNRTSFTVGAILKF